MKEYKVTWTIELDAESPEDAASKALEIQRDEKSMADYFTVEDKLGNKQGIELGSVALEFDGTEEPDGIQQVIELLENITETKITTPVYLTVQSHQGVIAEVNAYQSEASALKAEQEWLEALDIDDICSREAREQNGTSFQIFVTNLLP